MVLSTPILVILQGCLIDAIFAAGIEVDMDKKIVRAIAVDCHNHLQNLYIKWMKFYVGNKVKEELKDGLSELPFKSLVSTNFNAIISSFDKAFKDSI